MGIHGLLKQLPGGNMSEQRVGLHTLAVLRGAARRRAHIDAGGVVYICALRHKVPYDDGDYVPAAREFCRTLISFELNYEWDFVLVFDGCPPEEKRHEHQRRRARAGGVRIDATFIAMCVQICRARCVEYVVSPAEADMQVGRHDRGVPVCCDSDEVGYGNKLVVIVDDWGRGKYRVIDLDTAVTERMRNSLPLFYYYHRYGLVVIHWWAAIMGCDISENASGIAHVGPKVFFEALRSFDDKPPGRLTAPSFATALLSNAQQRCREMYSRSRISTELRRVARWFTVGGTYYDPDANVRSISGAMVQAASSTSCRHMAGDLNSKTMEEHSRDERSQIDAVQPHNLIHNSAARRETINGLSLPSARATVAECRPDELKAMIVARGGGVTGKDGKALNKEQLQRMVRAYLSVENENKKHTVYFKRDRCNNGIFEKIDTSERRTIKQIINQLLLCTEFEQPLRNFFADLSRLVRQDCFIDDFSTISLEAPEISERFIYDSFVHVGESEGQKSIWAGLMKVLEMDSILYHGVASENSNSIYIISKQRASQVRDEATRNQTAIGEKPKLAEYLVLMQLMVIPTTVAEDGHALGRVSRIMRSYCASCKAGGGMCYHRASLLWMQYNHWGEGRPTPKPSTSAFCSWVPGSRAKRTCSTVVPAGKLMIERLPRSEAEAEAKLKRDRKYNLRLGIDGRYDVFGGNENKMKLLEHPEYTSAARLSSLFECLEAAQGKVGEAESDSL